MDKELKMAEHELPQDKPWLKFWPEGVPKHIDYPEVPLYKSISNAAMKYPHKIAFSCFDDRLSYQELDIAASKLATGLHEHKINKGDSVVLFLPNSLEFAIAYYGVLKAGGIVIPVNPLYKQEDLEHVLNDSGAGAIITESNFAPLVKSIRDEKKLKTIIVSKSVAIDEAISFEEMLRNYSPNPPVFELAPKEDVAVIEYTGGTTGFPKGAMLTHYNLVANAVQNAAWFGWSSNDIIIGVLPFYHSWGACTCINSPAYVGARVIVLPRFDAEELLMTIEKQRATVLYGASSMFITLANSPLIGKYDLSSLKYVKTGAMPIPPEMKERWEKITRVRMILGYGLSEASPETHNSPPQRVKLGTVGIPIIDTDARIVDEKTGDMELSAGELGELVINGPQVMKGYLNRAEDNMETLRNGWLYTGDLAFMDEEGYFHIIDRKKETIKYKGYTIAPAEVEFVLNEHPAVKECAVVGKPDALASELPKAYVVLKKGYNLNPEELITFCEQRIAPYKKIREVEFTEELPKTQVGKVLRRLLRDKERET